MENKICKLFGTETPIIQEPMHTFTNGKMIAAIAEAGALGILGINSGYKIQVDATTGASVSNNTEVGDIKKYSILDTMTERNLMNEQIDAALENTFRPFAVEIATACKLPTDDPTALALVQLMRKRRLTIALFKGFGQLISEDWVKLLHDNGIKIMVVVTSSEQAEKAIARKVDVLIAKTTNLSKIIKIASDTPIIAGLDICTAEDVKNALNQGADGVYVYTPFAVCDESPVNDQIKYQILKSVSSELVHFDTPTKTIYSLPGALPNKLQEMSNKSIDKNKIFTTANRYQGLVNGMGKADLISGYTDIDKNIDAISEKLTAEQLINNLSKEL